MEQSYLLDSEHVMKTTPSNLHRKTFESRYVSSRDSLIRKFRRRLVVEAENDIKTIVLEKHSLEVDCFFAMAEDLGLASRFWRGLLSKRQIEMNFVASPSRLEEYLDEPIFNALFEDSFPRCRLSTSIAGLLLQITQKSHHKQRA